MKDTCITSTKIDFQPTMASDHDSHKCNKKIGKYQIMIDSLYAGGADTLC